MGLERTIWIYRIRYGNGENLYFVEGEDELKAKSKNLLSEAIKDAINSVASGVRLNINFSPPQDFLFGTGQCFPLEELERQVLIGSMLENYEHKN